MKAFLLAAGLGTRLRPLTDTIPKCLLPIRGTPLLAIWLELCAQAGIDSVLINVHAHSHAIKEFIVRQRPPVSVQIVEEPTLLGSAGTLAANRSWADGGDDFFVLYADVLTNADLRSISNYHCRARQVATLALNRVPDPSRCGVVSLNSNGVITAFEEKPQMPGTNLVFSGIMVASSEFLNFLPDVGPADIGFHVLPRLVGRMAGYELEEYLADIGTFQSYKAVQQSWPGLRRERQC